ncbi:MAG: hypothetical protein AB1648_04330 [Pseudomonadota bacterium]|jgi:hypothetical protein
MHGISFLMRRIAPTQLHTVARLPSRIRSAQRRRTLLVAALTLVTGLGTGTAVVEAADFSPGPAGQFAPGHSKPSLYVHQAKRGLLQRHGERWVLTLRGSAPMLSGFGNSPEQVVNSQELVSFVSGWKAIFGDAKATAALEITDAPASRDVILLELAPPQFGGRPDTVSYEVRPVTQTSRASLAALAERADGSVSTRFGRASLYVDATGGTVPLTISWTSNGGTFGLSFDNVTLSAGSLMSDFTEGNYVFIGTTGIDGQSFNPSGLFQGAIQVRVTLPASGPVTGSADVPSGFSLQASFCDSTSWVTLPNGAFSISPPSGGC